MLQYVLWGLSFVSLWITIIWINVLFLEQKSSLLQSKFFPRISVAVPCFNEESTVAGTIKSLTELDYPISQMEIIVINDGSTDGTAPLIENCIKKFGSHKIILLNKKNGGKAEALNCALKTASGDFFCCVDADTEIQSSSLKQIIPNFIDGDVGAVISSMKPKTRNNIYEKIQGIEYVMSNLLRRLMAVMNTLAITHGGLSVFRTSVLKKIGGFSGESGNTEDLEIALRLKAHGFKIVMEWGALAFTKVPSDFKSLWRQRIRWYRGFIYNHIKYRFMFFNSKYGLFGVFQFPLNIIGFLLLLAVVSIISYSLIKNSTEFIIRSLVINGYLYQFLDLPSFNVFVLSQNFQILFPIVISSLVGFYITLKAHKEAEEKLSSSIHYYFVFLFIYPYVMSLHWLSSIFQEFFKTGRRWR